MGWTSVMSACSAGHLEVVRLLVGKTADFTLTNNGRHSPLQYAASKNRHQVGTWIYWAQIICTHRQMNSYCYPQTI